MNKNTRGFTLIELAVAMFIIVLLLGSILVPLTTQVEQRQISDTQRTLEEIKEALIGFTVTTGYLPCPDTDNDGAENVNVATGQCGTIASSISGGNLPWQTLGIGSSDVWGNRFRYIVREQYARRSPTTTFDLNTTLPNLRVCATVATCGSALTSSAVAAVLSHGKNGYGAINSQLGAVNPAPTSVDELENTNDDRSIVSRVHTPAGVAAGEYDDIVTWLPVYILFNRMVTAGKLP
jgi:prepilin-type N-terminal cleavage/methylation domain-containing protein